MDQNFIDYIYDIIKSIDLIYITIDNNFTKKRKDGYKNRNSRRIK